MVIDDKCFLCQLDDVRYPTSAGTVAVCVYAPDDSLLFEDTVIVHQGEGSFLGLDAIVGVDMRARSALVAQYRFVFTPNGGVADEYSSLVVYTTNYYEAQDVDEFLSGSFFSPLSARASSANIAETLYYYLAAASTNKYTVHYRLHWVDTDTFSDEKKTHQISGQAGVNALTLPAPTEIEAQYMSNTRPLTPNSPSKLEGAGGVSLEGESSADTTESEDDLTGRCEVLWYSVTLGERSFTFYVHRAPQSLLFRYVNVFGTVEYLFLPCTTTSELDISADTAYLSGRAAQVNRVVHTVFTTRFAIRTRLSGQSVFTDFLRSPRKEVMLSDTRAGELLVDDYQWDATSGSVEDQRTGSFSWQLVDDRDALYFTQEKPYRRVFAQQFAASFV